jgi:hypothetical protein
VIDTMTFVRNMGGKVGDGDAEDEGKVKVRAFKRGRASGSCATSRVQPMTTRHVA